MTAAIKLNLGCGHSHRDGWVNVDHFAGCKPDIIQNLESFPWPWPDSSVDEIFMSHVMEHLGQETSVFLALMQEIYRVCRNGATLRVIVPHPRHDHFLSDPTHVRPITPGLISMFSQSINQEAIDRGGANTPLGIQLGIDIEMTNIIIKLDPVWEERLRNGEITSQDVERLSRRYNNVIEQYDITAKIFKPGRARLT